MRILGRIGTTFALVACLSGCAMLESLTRRGTGCEVRYLNGPIWAIGGVEIPFKTEALGTVKIANVTYNGRVAQKLSDSAQMLDLARQGNCSIMYAPGFGTMPADYRATIYNKVAESNRLMVEFGRALALAKTPAEGEKAAENVQSQAPAVAPPAASSLRDTPPPDAPVDSVARSAAQDLKGQIGELSATIKDVSIRLQQLQDDGAVRLRVGGFAPDSAAVAADRREALAADFQAAMNSVPRDRVPNVLLIGYADGTGGQAYNVALGLRRAEAVAEFLRRHHVGRPFHSSVTSGGIVVNGSDADARRVDIYVSEVAPSGRRT